MFSASTKSIDSIVIGPDFISLYIKCRASSPLGNYFFWKLFIYHFLSQNLGLQFLDCNNKTFPQIAPPFLTNNPKNAISLTAPRPHFQILLQSKRGCRIALFKIALDLSVALNTKSILYISRSKFYHLAMGESISLV